MNIAVAFAKSKKLLSNVTPENTLEAEMLICHILGIAKEEYLRDFYSRNLSEVENSELERVIAIRLTHKPLQQILKQKDFYESTFEVNEQVLIPRPDTEILVGLALEKIRADLSPEMQEKDNLAVYKILDLGTGTGAIGISLAKELNKSAAVLPRKVEFLLSDISAAALEICRKNIEAILSLEGFEKKSDYEYSSEILTIKTAQADVFAGMSGQQFDLITTNPPYIPTADKDTWQKELGFEPEIALTSGADGLDVYRKIFAGLKRYLKNDGILFGEIHPPQAEELERLASEHGFEIKFHLGLSRERRFISLFR